MSELLKRAYALHRAGQRAEAAELYRQVLVEEPEQPDALQLLGLIYTQQGQPARAAELIERAIVQRPDSAPFYANLAETYRALGQMDRAVEAARTAVKLAPEFPAALANLGIILVAMGRSEEALEPLQRASARLPGLANVHHILGVALLQRGRAEEALPHGERAVRLEPGRAIFHHNLGNCLQALSRLREAQDAYLEALRLDSSLARPHANLGYILHDMGRPDEALARLKQATELEPENAAYWETLAQLYDQRESFEQSIPCWERVLELAPRRVIAHRALGVALQEDGRLDQALAQFQKALAIAPDAPGVHFDLAGYYEITGDFVAAEAGLRTANRLDPDNAIPCGRLAHLLRGRLPDEDRALLEQHLADPTRTDVERLQLLYGLSYYLDARGEYARAAECAAQANALAKVRCEARGRDYVPAMHQLFVDGMRAVMDQALFGRLAGCGVDSRRPIFVFGLPRSGTTLIEQVLASHPAVHGAGELQLAARTMGAIPRTMDRPGPPLVCIEYLTPEVIVQLAQAHLAKLEAIDARAARVVDKMPHNYQFIGLMALLFPHATYVHCRRDLRDVAVSCWTTGFRSLEWACDMRHIASRFHQYVRLMDHWRQVLPVPTHEVVYEDFVTDLEGGVRGLLAAAGLDWDPRCLEFHRTERVVHTASFTQVRQPVYTKSIGRWRHYERELGEMFALLPQAAE